MINTIRFAVPTMLLVTVLGCGGSTASVKPRPMPEGATFTGVYHSPQYGEMQLVQTGDSVIGEYTKDEREGKINGTAEGNVLHFEWVEKRKLVSNKPTVTKGRGYFQYIVDKVNDDHVLKGEWGQGDDETGGGPWNAWKSKTGRPHLSSGSGESSGGESYEEPEESESYEEEEEVGEDIL
jgi:hypothetical protein